MVPADVAPATTRPAVFVGFNSENKDYEKRTDSRVHDGHESWKGTYRLHDVDLPTDEVLGE